MAGPGRVLPENSQVFYIARVDLIERAVMPGLVGPVVHHPVVAVLVRVQQRIAVELRGVSRHSGYREASCDEGAGKQTASDCALFHASPPNMIVRASRSLRR